MTFGSLVVNWFRNDSGTVLMTGGEPAPPSQCMPLLGDPAHSYKGSATSASIWRMPVRIVKKERAQKLFFLLKHIRVVVVTLSWSFLAVQHASKGTSPGKCVTAVPAPAGNQHWVWVNGGKKWLAVKLLLFSKTKGCLFDPASSHQIKAGAQSTWAS